MHGLVELLDCLDDPGHVVLSCVRAPLDGGIFNLFYALFRLPNVGQGYNEHYSLFNRNSLSVNLPIDLCLSRYDLRGPPPCIILVLKLW